MSLRNIGTVYRKELREALRDRRTLISSLLVPLILFPLVTAGFGALIVAMVSKAKKDTFNVVIFGGEDSPLVLESIRKIDNVKILPASPNWKEQIANKEIRVAIDVPAGFEASLSTSSPKTVTISKYKGELKSELAAENVEKTTKRISRQGGRRTTGLQSPSCLLAHPIRYQAGQRRSS